MIKFREITLDEKIGEGGYGEVFKGKWLGQDVAVKEFGRHSKNKAKLNNFIKEIQVISNLRHPAIVLYMGMSIH